MKITKLIPFLYPFVASDWKPQTDDLRGGVSKSNLTIFPSGKSALFTGFLNTTLFNAGFSGQRTTGSDRFYDWTSYKGLKFDYETPNCTAVDKTFTLFLKDRLAQGDDGPPPTNPNPDPALPPGPDTIGFDYHWKPECDPENPKKRFSVSPTFEEFRGDYRGRPTPGVLDLSTIRRVGFSVRSFDGTYQVRDQDGRYEMVLRGIWLWK